LSFVQRFSHKEAQAKNARGTKTSTKTSLEAETGLG
jgi:hypothetical protein